MPSKTTALRIVFVLAVVTALAAGCATLPDNSGRTESHALTDTDDTKLGQAMIKHRTEHPDESGFVVLGDGLDAFVARAVMAKAAERSIDTQYYLLHHDEVGGLFIHQLVKAADRGVRVRLLVDDMDMGGRDLGASVLDSHPNIEVRFFNPFSRKASRMTQYVTRLGSVTRRMHNKSFTIDNQVTILGGRNIGNEYFDADPDLAFGDLDVMAIGPVARRVSASFDQYWNSELAYPVTLLKGRDPTQEEIDTQFASLEAFIAEQQDSEYLQALKNSSLANKLRQRRVTWSWGRAEVVSDDPEKITADRSKTKYHLTPKLKPYFGALSEDLLIFSPYFVPGKEGTAYLTDLVENGIRVRVLTNSLASNDVGLVHAGYDKYRRDLLRGGVIIYEMNKKISKEEKQEKKGPHGSSKASLHAKSFVLDNKHVFIGSLNLDPRSVTENTEIGVVIQSPEIAVSMSEWFDQHIDKIAFRLELKKDAQGREDILWHGIVDGQPKTFDVDPYTGFWKRFGIALMGLLPIESQL